MMKNSMRKKNIKNFLKMILKYKRKHIVAMIISVIISLLNLLQPILLMKIIDQGIMDLNLQQVLKYTLWYLVVLVLQNLFNLVNTYLYSYIGKKFIFDLRIQLIEHIQKLSGDFFVRKEAGEVFTVFDDDIDNVEELSSQMLFSMISNILISLVMCIFLCYLQPDLFLIVLILQPLLYFTQRKYSKKSNELAYKLRNDFGKISKNVQEFLNSIMQYIKMNGEKFFWKNYLPLAKEYTEKSIDLDMAYAKSYNTASLISGIIACIIFGFGGYKIVIGQLTIGGLITFNQYSQKLFSPILMIIQNNIKLKKTLVSIDRIFNVLEEEISIKQEQPFFSGRITIGKIEYKNVMFSYENSYPIFDDFNLELIAGKFNGIVGKSGQGKTTIISLLLRLWDVQEGSVEIDDINVKHYDINILRSSIAVVSQDVFLFNDTVRNNLTLLNENISESELIDVAKKTMIYELIENLPEKFDTVVGDNGIKLSGGQRQRISIARALLQKATIIIFDEATAALDNSIQDKIVDNLFEVLNGRTVIIISHRLSAVKRCNVIHVIENGKVQKSGTHEKLLVESELYKELYSYEE